ncbi:hypothetical protein [Selenomonas infelix]|nr:hypothetical protein [Selenomonas infelix]
MKKRRDSKRISLISSGIASAKNDRSAATPNRRMRGNLLCTIRFSKT